MPGIARISYIFSLFSFPFHCVLLTYFNGEGNREFLILIWVLSYIDFSKLEKQISKRIDFI